MDLDIELLKARFPEHWRAKAMEDIWRAWYQRLSGFIVASYGARGQVEDLMQEVMMRVFRNLERYKPDYALSTWLYTIARNTCINHFAAESRGAGATLGLSEEPRAAGSVEAQVLGAEFERELGTCLADLGVEDRGIAFLVFYEQASYRHIAAVYDLPLHGVKNRVYRIRQQLRGRLEDYREQD